jgi:hypothetical protein
MPTPRPAIRCRCGATWTALGAAHCSACHRTFVGASLFDQHRTQRGEHGGCLEPAEIRNRAGYQQMFYRDGMWHGPEMTEQQKRDRFGEPE